LTYLVVPPRQFAGSNTGVCDFVDDVIDFSTKGVKRRDSSAALRRQKKKGVIKAAA
jgi:hypothetical protein